MDYTFRELECFIAVAEERSFTRAAARLRLAQPPLSRHVRTLENRLGVQLLIREPRGASLTAAGRIFLEETRDIPMKMERAGEMARRCVHGETFRLRLGFVSAVMNPEMVSVLRQFRERYPAVQLSLEDCLPSVQLPAIGKGDLDGGFVGLQPQESPPDLAYLPWYRERLVCLVPVDHRMAGCGSILPAALKDEAFVAVSSESAPAFSRHWRELCAQAGFAPKVVMESPRAQAVAAMVGAGSGIAILPAALADYIKGAVVSLDLEGVEPITHVLAVRKGDPSKPLQDFVRLLKSAD